MTAHFPNFIFAAFKRAFSPPLLIVALALFSAPPADGRTLSLEEAEGMAVNASLEVRLAGTEVRMSEGRRREASSRYYPNIRARLIPNIRKGFEVEFLERESGFFADQILWDFGRTRNRVKAQRGLVKAAKMSKEDAERDAVRRARKAFFLVILEEARLSYAEKSHGLSGMRLERSRILERNGRISNLELAEQESEERSMLFEKRRAENAVEAARFELFQLLGLEDGNNITLESPEDLEFEARPAGEIVASALKGNARLRGLAERLRSDKANVRAARAEYLPVIYGRVAYRFEGEGADAESRDFIAGAGATVPIFEGFSRPAKVERMRAARKNTEIKIALERQRLERDIRRLLLEITHADADIMLSRQVLGTAQEKLILAREKEKLGAGSILDLKFAEKEYAKFYLKYEESVYNRRVLLVDLMFLAGGLPLGETEKGGEN